MSDQRQDPPLSNPTSDPSRGQDLAVALELADLADALTMDRFRASDLAVSSKPDLSLVSDADQAVERAIREHLAGRRPDDAFLGEEYGRSGDSPRQWVVDPIDGTHSYVRGVAVWASLIALLDEGEPVLGVVSAPALGQRWWAARGQGAFATSLGAPARRLRVSEVSELADANLSYSSLTGWAKIDRQDQFLQLVGRVWRSRGYGDFWSYMLLAEGSVDLATEPELSLWDMAALAPIVIEAGGQFTGLNGKPGVEHGNALASNGRLHAAALELLGH